MAMQEWFGQRLLVGVAMIGMFVGVPAFAQPPEAPVRPVVDTYHGVDVTDPYRWLEEDGDAEVRQWSAAQNAYAREILDGLPGVETIRKQVTEIMSAETPSYSSVAYHGGRYFAVKRQPPKQQPMIVVLTSLDDLTSERVVVDANAIDPSGSTAIDWYIPSPDGALVAVSLSVGGTEAGDVHIYETDTGREVHEVVPHTNSGTAGGDLAWTPDGRGFYYTRHPWKGERPDADRGFYQQVYYHQLGTSPEQDRYEIGRDFPRIAEIQLDVDDATGRVLALVQNGDGGEFAHYLRAPDGTWQQFSTFGDRTVHAAFGHDDDLFLISLRDAPRGKIEHIAIADLGQEVPTTIIDEGTDAIMTYFLTPPTVAVTPNRLYLVYQLGGPSEVRAFDHAGNLVAAPEPMSLASIVEIEAGAGDDLLFQSMSYLVPDAIYRFDAEDGSTEKTALASRPPVDFEDAEVVREFATSKDGTRVPVNIIRRKGTKLDGNNPCYALGYGGYGVSLAPRFQPLYRILLDRGFVVTVANLRGGGEYGESWHLEGNLTKKQNVFDDFAAVLHHLIDRKYTSRERLAIIGGSNGGLLMGAIVTQHPQLAKVVVSYVGLYDMLRSELSPNGEFNITEFGTVKNPDHFQALHAYSPYHRAEDGVAYPPMLMLTGENDPRVEPSQSRKMTARLQAATASDAPILLRTSDGSGHGGDTPLAEQIAQTVDAYAFMFDQLGIEAPSQPDSSQSGAGD
jgi:prolyl oligopeptidase